MNKKEIAEIRRRFRPQKSSITHVRGCYVNEAKEIISRFDQPFGQLSEEECEMILTNLRRTLSGTLDKNLFNIGFDTKQVAGGEEHALLMSLRDSKLADHDAVDAFYKKVIQSVELEGSFLILLAADAYDVPFRSMDGEKQDDASSEVFSFFLCAVCPVKQTKPALGFVTKDSALRCLKPNSAVSKPEIGFIFPSFDDRSTNLYNTLFYTKDILDAHELFTTTMFGQKISMPAGIQYDTFQSILAETLEEDCCYEVVQGIQSNLSQIVDAHLSSKEPEPLSLNVREFAHILSDCGVEEDHVEAFSKAYSDCFGAHTEINPENILHTGQTELSLPDVTIRVKSNRDDLVETRVINNVPYVLIRADSGVEVNGVQIVVK